MRDKGTAYLFIDDACIESLEGAAKGVVPAQKVSDQPLIEKDEPWEEGWRIGSYINVIHDEEEDLFKMWYGVGRKLSDARGEEADALAYAISRDGYHWEKPVLNLVEDNGSTANNLVFPMFRWGAGTGVMKDPIELDPEKRYKMLFMFQSASMRFCRDCSTGLCRVLVRRDPLERAQILAQPCYSRGIRHPPGRLLGSKPPQICGLSAR